MIAKREYDYEKIIENMCKLRVDYLNKNDILSDKRQNTDYENFVKYGKLLIHQNYPLVPTKELVIIVNKMWEVEKQLNDTATSSFEKPKRPPTEHNLFVGKMLTKLKEEHPEKVLQTKNTKWQRRWEKNHLKSGEGQELALILKPYQKDWE